MTLGGRLRRAEHLLLNGSGELVERDPVDVMRLLGVEPSAWQQRVLRSTARRQLLAITRQGGKSTTAAVKAAHRTVYRPESLVIIVSPTQRQSGEVFRKCLQTYGALGFPVPAESETKLTVELVNGSRIISLPGTEATVRGYSAPDLILVDEAAKVEDELLYSVLPMMAANPDSQLIAMTTPYGKRGWFSDAFHSEDGDWEKHRVTVHEVEHITPAEVETFKRLMPAWWFASEFLVEFLDALGAAFSSDDIRAMVNRDLEEWDLR